MNKQMIIIMVLFAGFLLGIIFFGGLWWTTQKGIQSKSPALWFVGSLISRMGITITAFYFISRNHWENSLICLIGFVIARGVILKFTKNSQNVTLK